MKNLSICFIALAVVFATTLSATADEKKKEEDKIEITTLKQKVSYGIGLQIGNSLKTEGDDFDIKILIQGLSDAFSGEKPRMTPTAVNFALKEFRQKKYEEQQKKMKKAQEKSDNFLTENKKKKGVTTTKSGLQYEIITKGEGPTPKATDVVKTHYKGTLIDGTLFDSSHKRGEPSTFPVNGVIKGWTEALQLMKVGGKWKLTIPSELAYGKRGSPPRIAPDTVLVFELELLAIEKPEK